MKSNQSTEQELEQVQQTLGGSNYSNYRERLHSVNPPVLPYLYVLTWPRSFFRSLFADRFSLFFFLCGCCCCCVGAST